MKRVVLLKSRLNTVGGLEKATQHLAEAFVNRGAQVTLLTTDDIPLKGIEVIKVSYRHKNTLWHLSAFDEGVKQWLKSHSADCVFGMEKNTFQTHYRAGGGLHLAYLKQRALVEPLWKRFSLALNPQHRLLLNYEKKCLLHPALQKVFTNSKMVQKEIESHFPQAAQKIEVIPNGAPYKAWEAPFECSLKSSPRDCFEFLFVGNGFRRKGLDFLLEGLSRLPMKVFHLTVVGKDKELPFYQKKGEALGLPITFVGEQKETLPFYARADALVIPSLYDPCANVTLEALAMGLFVVSSHFNGASELLTSDSGSVIEDLTDPESVATSLKIALNHPKTAKQAKMIRETMKNLDFSIQWDKLVESTLNNS